MWLRQSVHKVHANGIVWSGKGDDGEEVLMTEVRGSDKDVAFWQSLVDASLQDVWGLKDVELLPSGAYLLVSLVPKEWDLPVGVNHVQEMGVDSRGSIVVQGRSVRLAIPWFQHPGEPSVHEEAVTAPTPIIQVPNRHRFALMLPGLAILLIGAGAAAGLSEMGEQYCLPANVATEIAVTALSGATPGTNYILRDVQVQSCSESEFEIKASMQGCADITCTEAEKKVSNVTLKVASEPPTLLSLETIK